MQIITQGVLKWHQKGNVNMQFAGGKVYRVSGEDNTRPDFDLCSFIEGKLFPHPIWPRAIVRGLCGGFWTGFPGTKKVIQSTCALDLAVWCGNPKKSCVLPQHGLIPISNLLNCTIL